MARIARFVVPGLPARRERMFLGEDDTALLSRSPGEPTPQAWAWRSFAYCLTPNHVHLILVPERKEALGRALGGGAGVVCGESTRGPG
jgi:putative transposase